MPTKDEQKANRARLVERLRSGRDKQIMRRLREEDGFCCLGVACDLVDPNKWANNGLFLGQGSVMPYLVMYAYDFCTSVGQYTRSDGSYGSLLEDNDSGIPFAKIADIIESEPEGLFL